LLFSTLVGNMASSPAVGLSEEKGRDHSHQQHVGDKLKLPFHGLKDKAHHNTPLHNAKVHLIHQK
jgi:phospholipase D1/2